MVTEKKWVEEQVECFIKLVKVEMDDKRYTLRVFMGKDKEHFQLAGALVLTVPECQKVITALSLGALKMVQTKDGVTYIPLKVIMKSTEGEGS